MKIPNQVRYFNKKVTNPFLMRFAGKKDSSFAILTHIGRKTGKEYKIPLMLAVSGETFVFALTYGENVDWYKNLLAANKGEILWQAVDYLLTDPQPIDHDSGRACFRQPKSTILKFLGIEHFFKMRATQLGRSH